MYHHAQAFRFEMKGNEIFICPAHTSRSVLFSRIMIFFKINEQAANICKICSEIQAPAEVVLLFRLTQQ
jgi:hypothetical protein